MPGHFCCRSRNGVRYGPVCLADGALPRAEELLELYLSGAKRSCTSSLCEKYRLSDRAVQKRKAAFEKFVLDL